MRVAQVEINVLSQVRHCPVAFQQGENIEACLCLGSHHRTAHVDHLDFNSSVWKHYAKSKESTQQLVVFALILR